VTIAEGPIAEGPQYSPRDPPESPSARGHRGRRPPSTEPTVTVVIPTHNRRDLLALALLSVLRQRDVAFEVVVVDDGSTDDTALMVATLDDPRIRLIRHDSPRGVSAARNAGIAEARGEWIGFLDDDDLWAPDKLALQLDAAAQTGRHWVYVGHVNVTMGHRVTGGAPPLPPQALLERLPQSDVVPGGCSGVLAAKQALDQVGYFDPSLRPLADWDLWLRLAQVGPPAWVPRPLVAYRLQTRSMSTDTELVLSEFEVLARRHGEGNRAILFRYLGWWSLRARRRRDALRYFVLGAWQRKPDYRLRDLNGDLRYLVGDLVRTSRLPIPIASARTSIPAAHQGWVAEGQAWVDALLAAGGYGARNGREIG
jgi:glycosyltransferase involved in cell wall biosynthesis